MKKMFFYSPSSKMPLHYNQGPLITLGGLITIKSMEIAQQDLVKFIKFLDTQFNYTFKPIFKHSSTPKPSPSADSLPPSAETSAPAAYSPTSIEPSAPAASSSPTLPTTNKIPDVEN